MKKPQIQMGPDFIRIMNGKDVIVCWHQREWKKNPKLVYKIVETVAVAAFEPELLEALISKIKK